MYKIFYGLTRSPFEISPDPHFLFPTTRHNEALASIYYGICHHKGFVVMTGEVGTGKTLLVRCLLELLSKNKIAFANVFNPQLSDIDFLRYIAGDLGLQLRNQSKGELLLEINHYLIQRHRNNQTTVLVVDEAQHLSAAVLEEVRLLTNLETSQQKLLQILLVGQPELEQKLDRKDLRQLKQRIGLRCRLEPLTLEETTGYILRRLAQAGAGGRSESIFPADSIAAIHLYSNGIPRLINTISENALIAAFSVRSPAVTPKMIEEVATEFRLGLTLAPSVDTIPSTPIAKSEPHSVLKAFADLIKALEVAGGIKSDGRNELLSAIAPNESVTRQ